LSQNGNKRLLGREFLAYPQNLWITLWTKWLKLPSSPVAIGLLLECADVEQKYIHNQFQ